LANSLFDATTAAFVRAPEPLVTARNSNRSVSMRSGTSDKIGFSIPMFFLWHGQLARAPCREAHGLVAW
jgi:hypothetical protein